MSETASHDVSDLQTAATGIRTVATAAQVASVTMTINMITFKCWGTDEIGQAFAEVYLPPATEVMDHVLDTGPPLGQITDTLAASADTEETNRGESTTVVPPDSPIEV